MKQIAVLFLLGISTLSSKNAYNQNFEIKIRQNSKIIPIKNGEVILDKEEFELIVELQKLDGVFLNADFSNGLYELTNDDAIPNYKDMPGFCMAEYPFNPDKELLINNQGWTSLFYVNNDSALNNNTRFDKIVTTNKDTVTGFRTIQQFMLVNRNNEILKVSDAKEPLYLFIFASMLNPSGDWENYMGEEIKRFKFKINWK